MKHNKTKTRAKKYTKEIRSANAYFNTNSYDDLTCYPHIQTIPNIETHIL